MTESRKVVRVFLASPGDLGEERKLAKSVTDRWNAQWADFLGLQIELVGWEDTVSVYGRPQAIINQDLARCELFVGMLWQEWGTPTGAYSSGFEEEFRTSEESRNEHGRPEISLLFKQVEESRKRDPGERLKKVLDFQAEVRDRILYQMFKDDGEFQEKFESILTRYIQKLIESERSPEIKTEQAPSSEEPPGPRSELPPAASTFVRSFIERSESAAVDSVELARFRLVGTALNAPGNDETSLGTHDANILFAARMQIELTSTEKFALLDSGLDHLRGENTPVWYWLDSVGGFEGDALVIRTAFGLAERRIGALTAMRLLETVIIEDGIFSREFYRAEWFSSDTPNVKVAALQYLQTCGDERDLGSVKAEIERANYQTTKAAMAAYVSILCRDSRDAALAALNDLQPESVDDEIVSALFSKANAISDETLLAAMSHRAATVRRAVARELRNRSALTSELALQLSEDEDVGVRLEALLQRLKGGEEITSAEARRVLVRKAKSGWGGVFGALSTTEVGQDELRTFEKAALRDLTKAELQRLVEEGDVLGQEYEIELRRRSFASQGSNLRAAVRDGFRAWFDTEYARFETRITNADTRSRVRGIETTLRSQWMRQALDVLIEKGGGADVALLRQALGSEDLSIEPGPGDVHYLGKHGEWTDVDLLISLADRRRRNRSLLSAYIWDDDTVAVLAKALCALARGRLPDLLAKEMPVRLRSAVFANCSADCIRALDDAAIVQWLKHESDAVRRTLALRCVLTMSKRRLTAILGAYAQGTYFYNVVVWLDMGISCPASSARSVAKKALEFSSWN